MMSGQPGVKSQRHPLPCLRRSSGGGRASCRNSGRTQRGTGYAAHETRRLRVRDSGSTLTLHEDEVSVMGDEARVGPEKLKTCLRNLAGTYGLEREPKYTSDAGRHGFIPRIYVSGPSYPPDALCDRPGAYSCDIPLRHALEPQLAAYLQDAPLHVSVGPVRHDTPSV